jgi:hypothetical protein
VDTEEEASRAGTAREEEAVGDRVEERWRHGTQRRRPFRDEKFGFCPRNKTVGAFAKSRTVMI